MQLIIYPFGQSSSPFGSSQSVFGQQNNSSVFGADQTPSPFSFAFHQSSNPSGSSQSDFGQRNNSSNNLFGPKPFGSPTPFESGTGNSMSEGTSAGVFGAAQKPSLLSSNTTFGASSSTPPFAFRKSSNPSGSSQSVYGQQNNSSNNLFPPKPFGSPTPFESGTGNSMSEGTSAGVFGATQKPSFFSSNTTFGASSSTPPFAFRKSSNPSGSSQSVYGQQNNSSNNLFPPKPFGSPTPFESGTGNSMSEGTSACVFGPAQKLSLFSSNTTFRASSSTPPFAFRKSSNPTGSSQSVFGQQNNSSNNLFGPKPFGSPTPFGSETGNSMSGATSTGVFGAAQTPSLFSSNTNFGASSSTPAFGNSSSLFGGSSVFGPEHSFGGFGSTPTQTSPCRTAIQPSQPAFGSNDGFMIVDRASQYGSLNVHDQYREMRMDINGMGYEELLALGERIGNVGTGLSEDLISKYLTKTLCSSADQSQEGNCAICLEEYMNKDDIGTLKTCGHDYHMSCIRKWLSMKKVCPICKASALPDE